MHPGVVFLFVGFVSVTVSGASDRFPSFLSFTLQCPGIPASSTPCVPFPAPGLVQLGLPCALLLGGAALSSRDLSPKGRLSLVRLTSVS